MINTAPLEDVIKMTIYSGYLMDENPVSLLVVAGVEAGKTELVKKFKRNKGLIYLTDCTAYGIAKNYLPEMETGKIKHLVIPDLITPLSKSKTTRNSFISFLNNLVEEGVIEIQTYAITSKRQASCGLITCIARQHLLDARHQWNKMGFMSRMLSLSWDYPQSTIIKIFESIIDGGYRDEGQILLNLPENKTKIKDNKAIFKKLIPFSIQFAHAEKIYGFRMQKHLQRLLMASALERGSNKVEQEDFDRLLNVVDYLNLDFKKI